VLSLGKDGDCGGLRFRFGLGWWVVGGVFGAGLDL